MEQSPKNEKILKLYAELFLNFEYVVSEFRRSILHLIFPDSSQENQIRTLILLEGLFTDQLRNKFVALILQTYKKDSEMYKLAKRVSIIFGKILPIRNSFAHGLAFIGKIDHITDTQDGHLIIQHPKLTKAGLDHSFKTFEIQTFEPLIEMLTELSAAMSVINFRLEGGKNQSERTNEFNDKKFKVLSEKLLRLEKNLSCLN